MKHWDIPKQLATAGRVSSVRLGTSGRVWQRKNQSVLKMVLNMLVPGQVIPAATGTVAAESIKNVIVKAVINGVVRPALKNPVPLLTNIPARAPDTLEALAPLAAENIPNVSVQAAMNGKMEVAKRKY